MNILLTGKNGQLGFRLAHALAPLGTVTALGHDELDLRDERALRAAVRAARPGLVVNAAAYTAVDRAEDEPDMAMAVNGRAPGVVAEECRALGAGLIHYSTDYVFDGAKGAPYVEDDAPNPLGVYGASKLAGERAVAQSGAMAIILRTSWVYDSRGHNFLRTILRLAEGGKELRVVDDQRGVPNWAGALAQATAEIVKRVMREERPENDSFAEYAGLYHLTAPGEVTWRGFAEEIVTQACRGKPGRPVVTPITTAEYPTKARRPAWSVLSPDKLTRRLGVTLPPWRESLKSCMAESLPA